MARRAELFAQISVVDELVSRLQNNPDSSSLYLQGLSDIAIRKEQRMKAASYRIMLLKDSIHSAFSDSLIQLAKSEKVRCLPIFIS